MQEMIILVGNIGCGKSSYTNVLVSSKEYIVANMDNIITTVGGTSYADAYDKDKEPVYQDVEETIIESALRNEFSIIIDRTCMSKKVRKKYIMMGAASLVTIIVVDFGEGTDASLDRRLAENKGVEAETWRKVHKTFKDLYEKPTMDEGIDKIILIKD